MDHENYWIELWEQVWIVSHKFAYSCLHCWYLVGDNAKSIHCIEDCQNYCFTFGLLCVHLHLQTFS